MRDERFEGRGLDHPSIRSLFTRESLLASGWYAARLKARQRVDIRLWQRHVRHLEEFLTKETHASEAERLGIRERLSLAKRRLLSARQTSALKKLYGTLGTDPAVLAPEPNERRRTNVDKLRSHRERLKRVRRRVVATGD